MRRGLRLFGHPVHAMISDLPVALLGSSLLWDALGLLRGGPIWWAVSFWDIALGLATMVLAMIAGVADFAALARGHPALDTATRHMLVMLSAGSCFVVSLAFRGGPAPPSGRDAIVIVGLEGVGLLLLLAGGWYGGELVFRYGIGQSTAEDDDRVGGS
jgi:uncharacterized membrane protein